MGFRVDGTDGGHAGGAVELGAEGVVADVGGEVCGGEGWGQSGWEEEGVVIGGDGDGCVVTTGRYGHKL